MKKEYIRLYIKITYSVNEDAIMVSGDNFKDDIWSELE